jgi:hypothetical protein
MPTESPAAPAFAIRILPLAGGAIGLAVAGGGEFLVRQGPASWLFLLLYVVGIVGFTVSAWSLPPGLADGPGEPQAAPASTAARAWLAPGIGLGVAILANLAALRSLAGRWESPVGEALWLISVVLVVAAGMVLGRQLTWPAQWGVHVWPASALGRRLLIVAVVAIFVLAAASRLLWLDRIPLGINPDEGDRGSTALQIVRGTLRPALFDYGWFGINILYFWSLAHVMQVAGLTFVGARVFGALCGIATVATVAWIGLRHFGYRVGLMAGGLLAVMGVALQFSREITEATPTALLWALSVASFLEAARCGRPLAWVLAGASGGLSFYFYPSGRLWALVAALFCVYLMVRGAGGRRAHLVTGVALAAFASLLVLSPFVLRASETRWESFTTRARMTSIFVKENPLRLQYYNKEWSTPRLLQAQLEHSLGIFNRYPDMNAFWPTHRPLFPAALALLTLVGLGWVCLRPRDPRLVLIAIWFWVGIAGMVVTVETPNLQRMAAAVPALALLPALVLDNLVQRLEHLAPAGARARRLLSQCGGGAAALAVVLLMVHEWRFYFFTYGPMDEWSGPTLMGNTVHTQGSDTLVMSLGRQSHIVNQGWVRLLAPETPRAGLPFPGHDLPLAQAADGNLAFMVMPEQPWVMPYVRGLYASGTTTPIVDRGQLLFHMYRVPHDQWLAQQGALAKAPSGSTVRVSSLGAAPPGWSEYPTRMRWSAAWRVPQPWDYAIRIGPGPASVRMNGTEVLVVPEGAKQRTVRLSLAQGDHFVEYDGTLTRAGETAQFEWALLPGIDTAPGADLTWQSAAPGTLRATATGPDGLFGVVTSEGRADQQRLDGTLYSASLAAETGIGARPFAVQWRGTLHVPAAGRYRMSMFVQGAMDLRLDGHSVLRSSGPADQPITADLDLAVGAHAVEADYRVANASGAVEWTWTPPGGEPSIVPRWVLTPPPGAGVAAAGSTPRGPAPRELSMTSRLEIVR